MKMFRRFTINKREEARIFVENRIGYFNKFYSFEINRIAQDQPRQIRELTRLDRVLDFQVRLAFDPAVNLFGGCRGRVDEINLSGIGLIKFADQVQKRVSEVIILLAPKRVGRRQRDTVPTLNPGHARSQFTECHREVGLGEVEMKHPGHFGFCLSACAGIGHRQRSGNAVRREKQIARRGRHLAVEIQGEGRVAGHNGLDLSRPGAWNGKQGQAHKRESHFPG